ncbi:ComEC/Rec2 family competence protein [Jatrophihabitans sp. YIM 134969]
MSPRSAAAPVAARDGPPVPPLDLRLAIAAAAGWLGAVLVVAHGSGLAALVGGCGAVLLVVGAVAARRRGTGAAGSARRPTPPAVSSRATRGVRVEVRHVLRALGLAGAGLAVVLLPLAARLGAVEHSSFRAVTGPGAQIDLTVGAVHRLAAGGVSPGPRVLVEATATAVSRRGRTVPVRAQVVAFAPAGGWVGLVPGQPVRVDASVRPAEGDPWRAAVLSVRGPPELTGRPPALQRWAAHVRAGLVAACSGLPDGPRGLLPGLVVGDTSGLDPVLEAHFRAAGLTHLVAVSGTNCAVVVAAGVLLVRRLRAGPVLTAACGVVLLVAFVVVAGPSPSVVRAAAMAAIALGALASGRSRSVVPALSAAVLVALVWRPALATDAGFAMSVFATAAIVLAAPTLAERWRRARVPVGLAEAVAVAVVAHLVTAPVAAAISGQVSVVAIPANIAAEPVVAVTTVLGFLAAVLAAIAPVLGAGPAWLAAWPCRWLIAVADRFGTAPGATVGWLDGGVGGLALAAVLAVGAVLWRWRRTRRWVLAAVLVAAIVQVPVRAVVTSWPPPGWWFVACDIGQGDALVLRAGEGAAVVVDTGPDPVPVDTCLRRLGVHHVPLLLLTHMDLDHVGGVAGVVRGRDVGVAVTSPLPEPADRTAAPRAALAPEGVVLRTAPVGAVWQIGAVRLEFLAPRADELASGCDPNDCSVVARATVGGHRVLLTADESADAQDRLLAAGVDLSADVLKVPHHGSRFTDPAFLAAAHARLAVVSVGAENRYGHPAPATMAALGRLGVPVARTDLDGGVAVASGADGALAVTTERQRAAVPAATVRPVASLAELSDPSVTMASCHQPAVGPDPAAARGSRARTASTRSPRWTRCPRSSCCSVTRSCWSRAPPRPWSSRCGSRSPRSRSSSDRVATSSRPRSPNC